MELKKYFYPAIVSIVSMMNIIGFIKPINGLYFSVMTCILVCLLIKGNLKLYYPLLMLVFVCVLSLVCNNYNSIFKPWYRLSYFCIILGVVSPIIQNDRVNLFRMNLFKCVILLLVIASIASFVCYFFGVNFMHRNEFDDITVAGSFSGILNHSMVLGPVAALSCCYLLPYLFYSGLSNRKKIIVIIILLASFGALLLSASRGALVGGLAGFSFILYKLNKRRLMRLCKYLLLTIGLLYPIWSGYSSMMLQKQRNNLESGSFMISRESKWESRIIEFESSPFFGIGFATIDPNGFDLYNRETGTIEPGTSWGSILSMTGILGFLLITYIVLSNWVFLFKDTNNVFTSTYLGGCLSFFIVHLLIEGYVFAAGSFLCFLFWLLLGVLAVNRKYHINLMFLK